MSVVGEGCVSCIPLTSGGRYTLTIERRRLQLSSLISDSDSDNDLLEAWWNEGNP